MIAQAIVGHPTGSGAPLLQPLDFGLQKADAIMQLLLAHFPTDSNSFSRAAVSFG